MGQQTEMDAEQINRLFDLAIHQLNYPRDWRRREKWIFDQALGLSRKNNRLLLDFLRDVRTCPAQVIAFCQMILSPSSGKLPPSIAFSLARHHARGNKHSLDNIIVSGKRRAAKHA